MIEKYLAIIRELDNGNAERNTQFCNSISQLAYDRHGLNATAETEVQNAFCDALDMHFNNIKIDQYRYDSAYGKLYKYDEEAQAYIFACSNPFNLSESELIGEYEDKCQ